MKTIKKIFIPFFLFLLLLTIACQIPQDPNRTLENVEQSKIIRVGVIVNEPWTKNLEGEPAGVEVELIRNFAEKFDARPVWVFGNEGELFESVKHFELDMVIGGLAESSLYSKHAAFTNPYFTEEIVVGERQSDSLQDISGKKVFVEIGDVASFYLKEKEAQPIQSENPFENSDLVAAPVWKLNRKGFQPTSIKLYELKHIIAVPPGENRWLVTLDNFLAGKNSQVESLLREKKH